MRIDGIAASQAIDTSAERIDIENLDISSLQAGQGVFNWEHKDPKRDKSATALDILGAITFAKKIFSAKDCDDERQKKYWEQIKLPFVYVRGELFDEEDHECAKAVASIFRFYWKRKLPVVARFSIDGITVERKDNELTCCIARDVAITMKPANHSCITGVLDDAKAGLEEPEDKLARSEEGMTRLTGVSFTMMPFDEEDVEEQELTKAMTVTGGDTAPGMLRGGDALAKEHVAFKSRLKAAVRDWPRKQVKLVDHLKKSLPDVNPDLLEKFVDILEQQTLNKAAELYDRLDKAGLRGQALEDAIAKLPKFHEQYDEGVKIGTKLDFSDGQETKNLKAPTSPDDVKTGQRDRSEFEDTITGKEDRKRMVNSVNMDIQDRNARDIEAGKQTAALAHGVTPQAAEAHIPGLRVGMHPDMAHRLDAAAAAIKAEDIEADDLAKDEDAAKSKRARQPKQAKPTVVEPKKAQAAATRAAKVKPAPEPEPKVPLTVNGKTAAVEPGVEHSFFDTGRGALVTPRGTLLMDIHEAPEARELFNKFLSDKKYAELHDYAMRHWIELNKRLRAGTMPPEALMHAVLFAQMSPQTSVPVQELMHGYLADYMRDNGIDARDPAFGTEQHREGWKARNSTTEFPVTGSDPDDGRSHWDRIRGKVILQNDSEPSPDRKSALRQKGQIYAFQKPDQKFDHYVAKYHLIHDRLMDIIARHKDNARTANAELIDAKGVSAIPGLGAKTTPYFLGMLGAGNSVVADTHFTRHVFGLDVAKDADTIEYVKRQLWDTKTKAGYGQKILDGINDYYAAKHPAVDFMKNHPVYGSYFAEHPDQILFPAFWRHWMAAPDHEVAAGRSKSRNAMNQETDHKSFFQSIRPFLYGVRKGEEVNVDRVRRYIELHQDWAEKYGEMEAMTMYYAFIVPLLLGLSDDSTASLVAPPQDGSGGQITSYDGLTKAEGSAPSRVMTPASFRGKLVIPGQVEFRAGTSHPLAGQKLELLGFDGTHFHMRNAQGTTMRVDGSHQHKAFKVVAPAQAIPESKLIQEHHLTPHSRGPEQLKMMLGLDLAQKPERVKHGVSRKVPGVGFIPAPDGSRAFIKPGIVSNYDDGLDDAHAETSFANIARDYFGLGDMVPTTASFWHPEHEEMWSAQRAVDGMHGSDDPVYHKLAWLKSGLSSKLATVDFLLGNDDRHTNNYLIGQGGKPFLIDHGHAFQYGPRYLTPGYIHEKNWNDEFPDATKQWIAGLNPQEFQSQLAKNGIPAKLSSQAVARLQNLQSVIADRLPVMYSSLHQRYPVRQG